MTIRLRCAECQRDLKVPDEALGKPVRCPACGARFIGRIDSNLPPSSAPTQGPPANEPALPSSPVEPAAAPVPNLELEEPASVEVVEPIARDAEAIPADERVELVVEDDEPVMDVTEAAEETDDAVELQAVEEDELAGEAKPTPKKMKSRPLLCGCLAGIGLVMLLGCGGAGFFGYRFWIGRISDDEWRPFAVLEADCSVSMPGTPVHSTDSSQPGIPIHRYLVEKPLAQSDFLLLYYDLPVSNRDNQVQDARIKEALDNALLDARVREEIGKLSQKLDATLETEQSIQHGRYQGKEARLRIGGNRSAILRVYLVTRGQQIRVYGLVASGPNMDPNTGTGGKFLNSFQIVPSPADQPRTQPQPRTPPQPKR